MKRTQRRKGLHHPPPASTLSSPLYERILQFRVLSSLRQQGTDVRMFAQEFSDAAEGLGFNHAALKDMFNSVLDEPLNWWRMRGLDHLSFGEFVGSWLVPQQRRLECPRWRLSKLQSLQWRLSKLQCLQWRLSKLQSLQWRLKKRLHPQLWLTKLQHPRWRLKKLRHPVLRNGGGGGRRLLPPFKAWRPFQSRLLARRPSLSRSSSSPCRRRPSSSPCRRHPGFMSCRAHPGSLPSCWLPPGLLTG